MIGLSQLRILMKPGIDKMFEDAELYEKQYNFLSRFKKKGLIPDLDTVRMLFFEEFGIELTHEKLIQFESNDRYRGVNKNYNNSRKIALKKYTPLDKKKKEYKVLKSKYIRWKDGKDRMLERFTKLGKKMRRFANYKNNTDMY